MYAFIESQIQNRLTFNQDGENANILKTPSKRQKFQQALTPSKSIKRTPQKFITPAHKRYNFPSPIVTSNLTPNQASSSRSPLSLLHSAPESSPQLKLHPLLSNSLGQLSTFPLSLLPSPAAQPNLPPFIRTLKPQSLLALALASTSPAPPVPGKQRRSAKSLRSSMPAS